MSGAITQLEILQHSEGTPPGSVLEWASLRGIDVKIHRLDQGARLSKINSHALLVILGGPMSVWEVDQNPWLAAEKSFLKDAITSGQRCLGLCLGGQLLSEVLGAEVRPSGSWEVGWHDVTVENIFSLYSKSGPIPDPAVDQLPLRVFQWHQDCFSLPPQARRIATNGFSQTQGFAYGDNVVGLQFHPESTSEFVRECAEDPDYPTGPLVQKPSDLLEGFSQHQPPMKAWFFQLLDRLCRS